MAFSLFLRKKAVSSTSDSWDLRREWDKARAAATTPNELLEIDAIFSRATE